MLGTRLTVIRLPRGQCTVIRGVIRLSGMLPGGMLSVGGLPGVTLPGMLPGGMLPGD